MVMEKALYVESHVMNVAREIIKCKPADKRRQEKMHTV